MARPSATVKLTGPLAPTETEYVPAGMSIVVNE